MPAVQIFIAASLQAHNIQAPVFQLSKPGSVVPLIFTSEGYG